MKIISRTHMRNALPQELDVNSMFDEALNLYWSAEFEDPYSATFEGHKQLDKGGAKGRYIYKIVTLLPEDAKDVSMRWASNVLVASSRMARYNYDKTYGTPSNNPTVKVVSINELPNRGVINNITIDNQATRDHVIDHMKQNAMIIVKDSLDENKEYKIVFMGENCMEWMEEAKPNWVNEHKDEIGQYVDDSENESVNDSGDLA